MNCLAPIGAVYQAGTLSGNPIAMAAGLTALRELRDHSLYDLLESSGQQLENGLKSAAAKAKQDVQFHRIGSMFCSYFTSQSVSNMDDAMSSDLDKFSRFFQGMLSRGVYLAPSQFEAGFISAAHTEADIQKTIDAATETMASL